MEQISCYGRWHGEYTGGKKVDALLVTDPQGRRFRRPIFLHQPTVIRYDEHGYESITPAGEPCPAARFTPDRPGPWRYAWVQGEEQVADSCVECSESEHPGYIEISRRDPRYFACTNGQPYVAIGLNLCWPEMFPLTTGHEFQTGKDRGTLGAREFERWFRLLSLNGGNFARLWLGMHYFQPEGDISGQLDLLRFSAIDRVVELAREYGIRLKLCLEYFRTFRAGTAQSRTLHHPLDGRVPGDMDEWFLSPDWQQLWWLKVEALLARYGDDPTVMAWELWNEINCCATQNFEVQNTWTRQLLRRMKAASPRNLVTNSLGSFDRDSMQAVYDSFKMDEMDFQQVHRYLDQGASLELCRTDGVAFSLDAIQRARRADRPVLLAETGAVNDCHSGPFRYYRSDHDGLIFHDTTYPAFFGGAAGSGHIWHWDRYVDQKNLWGGFRALAEALRGVDIDAENLLPDDWSTDSYWCLILRGRTTTLGWLRNRTDRWDHVLRDGRTAVPVEDATLDLAPLGISAATVELFHPWPEDGIGAPAIIGKTVHFPAFVHGLVFRLLHGLPR